MSEICGPSKECSCAAQGSGYKNNNKTIRAVLRVFGGPLPAPFHCFVTKNDKNLTWFCFSGDFLLLAFLKRPCEQYCFFFPRLLKEIQDNQSRPNLSRPGACWSFLGCFATVTKNVQKLRSKDTDGGLTAIPLGCSKRLPVFNLGKASHLGSS